MFDDPTRWQLILTVPDSAPREYRDSLRRARSSILAQAEQLAKAGIALEPRLEGLDAALLGHTMLSFAEMLGRLAVNEPDGYPRERLESYAAAAMPKHTRTARHRTMSENVGGPEAMSGAVVANFESLQSSPAKSAAVYSDSRGVPPAEVVFFPHDTTVLNTQGREQMRQAVEAFRAHGGQGFIRVVGHSSSRTANMTVERHMVYNFERSQARANSVARALIAAGVPAGKVLVEAVGDTQPVYYESMPQGEEGKRSEEIFVQ